MLEFGASRGVFVLKLVIHTLVALFLVMLIAGRGTDVAPLAQGAPDSGDVQVAQAMNGLSSLFDAAKFDPQSDPVAVPVPARAESATSPVITPVRPAPMPGPALRPSPEYRVKDEAPSVAGGALFLIDTNSANVRSGPSTGNPVVERLARGEEVLVISDSSSAWVRIRIEGDGVEGWIARSLLRPAR